MTFFYPNQLVIAEDITQFSNNIVSGIQTQGIFNYNSNSSYSVRDYLKDQNTGNLYQCKKEIPKFSYSLPILTPSYVGNYISTGQTVIMVTTDPLNPLISTGLLFLEEDSIVGSFPDETNLFSSDSILSASYDNFNNSGLWFSTSKGLFNLIYNGVDYTIRAVPTTSSYNITQIQITSTGYVIFSQEQGKIFYINVSTPLVTPSTLFNGSNNWVDSCTDNSQFVYFAAYGGGVYYINYLSPTNLSLQLITNGGFTNINWKSLAINLDYRIFMSSEDGQLYTITNNNSIPSSITAINNSSPVNDTFIEQNQIVDFQGNVYFIGINNIWSISPLLGFNVSSINLQCPNPIINGCTDGEGYPYFFGFGGYVFKLLNIYQPSPYVSTYFLPDLDVLLNSLGNSITGNIYYCAQSTSSEYGYIFLLEQGTQSVTTISTDPDYNDTSMFALSLNGYESFKYSATIGDNISNTQTLNILQTMSFISRNNITLTLFDPHLAPEYTIGIVYRVIATYTSGLSTILTPSGVMISGQSVFELTPYDSLSFVHDGVNFYCI